MSQSAGTCPHCGAITDRKARFCQVCGARVDVTTGPSVPAILFAILLLMAAAALGALGACFVLFGMEGGGQMLAIGGIGLALALGCALGAAALLTPKRVRE